MQSEQKSIRARIIDKLKTRFNSVKFNMTPMIDIVFLLLVFFLATARFRPHESKLPMQLPAPQGGGLGRVVLVEPLRISVNSESSSLRIAVEGEQFLYTDVSAASLINFAEQLNAIYQTQRRRLTDPIELDCGENLSWEHLVKFYNLMYGIGVTNITFVTD
jgi:biopolymer transport protein ExbD